MYEIEECTEMPEQAYRFNPTCKSNYLDLNTTNRWRQNVYLWKADSKVDILWRSTMARLGAGTPRQVLRVYEIT